MLLYGMQRLPLWGNGDDRRQRRKQGGAVGAAASRMQATAQQTLGAATRPCLRSRLRGWTKTEPFLCRKVRLVASLPVSFCRSLWYTYFAPGALALTPDQQDGVGGKKPAAVAEELVFQTLCRQAGKTALYPECPAAKKLRTTLALPLKSLWVQKKSPPGWASSTNRCRKLWRCLTAQRGGNAAALPGKAGVNQPTNGRSVLAGASVRMARTSGTIS